MARTLWGVRVMPIWEEAQRDSMRYGPWATRGRLVGCVYGVCVLGTGRDIDAALRRL